MLWVILHAAFAALHMGLLIGFLDLAMRAKRRANWYTMTQIGNYEKDLASNLKAVRRNRTAAVAMAILAIANIFIAYQQLMLLK